MDANTYKGKTAEQWFDELHSATAPAARYLTNGEGDPATSRRDGMFSMSLSPAGSLTQNLLPTALDAHRARSEHLQGTTDAAIQALERSRDEIHEDLDNAANDGSDPYSKGVSDGNRGALSKCLVDTIEPTIEILKGNDK